MTTIELTNAQRQALQAQKGGPVDVVDPDTQERYVLLTRELYERVRSLLEQDCGQERSEVALGIPPGILRSQQAFWRDLPQLLSEKRQRGSWVLYHLDERVGIARNAEELIRECIRRGIRDDECYLTAILARPLAPWEVEDATAPTAGYGPVELQAIGFEVAREQA